jgi:RPA family protein
MKQSKQPRIIKKQNNMKKIANYLIAMALMAFTFTSCEDVPNPFGQILPPGSGEDVETFEPAGSGTQADPFNVQGVLDYVTGLGADVQSDKEVFIKGYITTIKEQFSAQYGNAQFTISDSKEGGNTFTFYRGLYLGNKKWVDGDATVNEGDEVIICGKVVNYKGTTPETVQNAAYVYSINGKTEGGGGDTPTPTPTEAKAVSVKDFLAAAENTSDWYQLTGTIKNLKDGDLYGNFDIDDGTGSVYVYGLLSEKGGEKKKFQELVAAKGIANGKKNNHYR